MNGPRHIIVSAHQCAPGMGSEHAVGWNLVSRLARRYPLLLITEDNGFRPRVEEAVQGLRREGCSIEVFFVRHGSDYDGRTNRLAFGYYLTYIRFQRRVLELARDLQRRYDVAATHHLTINGFREPGFLWQLDVPFIWGPVGGLLFSPPSLYPVLTSKGRLIQRVRSAVTRLQFRYSPRVRRAYAATQRPGAAFIAAAPEIGERFRRRFGGEVHWIPETGSQPPVPAAPTSKNDGPLRLLWVGAIIERKPLGLLLEAIARVPDHRSRIALTVVGDGDSRARYESIARELGVAATFLGWIPHEDTPRQFDAADLFVLLSVQDLTTNVVFESLARGLPVLCLDHHGYAAIVDETSGIKVPVRDLDRVRGDLAQRLDELAGDRARLLPLVEGARRRAEQFTWERNSERIAALYDRALAVGATASEGGPPAVPVSGPSLQHHTV